MKKIIEVSTIETGLICDNPSCSYEDKSVTYKELKKHIDRACPWCLSNLLTKHDYKLALYTHKIIKLINAVGYVLQFFGYRPKSKDYVGATVHTHKTVNIDIETKP